MVVEKILKELTPERAEKEIKAAQKIKIPPKLQIWVKEYEKVGKRNEFTWKLYLYGIGKINYIFVPKNYRQSFQEAKFLVAMFIVLLDDVTDVNQNRKLLNELLKIPFMEEYIITGKLNRKEKAYLKFTIKVWHRIEKLVKEYPGYNRLKDIFKFDINQIMNAIEYDHLTHESHHLINKTEFWLYPPHTMQFITGTVIDSLLLPISDFDKLSIIRKIGWEANKMSRIGNWLSTWEEEIENNDFSSGVFSSAIELNVLTIEDLTKNNASRIIAKIKKTNIENMLLKEWEECHWMIFNMKKEIKVINIPKLLDGLKELLIIELARKNI